MRITVLLLAIPLSGCAGFQARMEAQRQAVAASNNAAEDAQCRNFGYPAGTPAYAECRMTMAVQRNNIQAAQDMHQQQIYSNMVTTGIAAASR